MVTMNRPRAYLRPLLPGTAVALVVAMVGYVVHSRIDVISPHVVAVGCGILGATFIRIDERLSGWRVASVSLARSAC